MVNGDNITWGNCTGIYQSGPICYVNEPSNCSDLVFSKSILRHYSWEACANPAKGKHMFTISRHDIKTGQVLISSILYLKCIGNVLHSNTNEKYKCTNTVCKWDKHREDVDWGHFAKSTGNCTACVNFCDN